MADGKDGKYLTRILGMKAYRHTSNIPEDQMRRVLGTNALLAAVQDVCADWIKVPGIPAIAKKKMRALLEAWGTVKDFKVNTTDVAKGALLVKLPALPLTDGQYGVGKAVTAASTTEEVLEDTRISEWMAEWFYDGDDKAWQEAVREVFGRCKSDGDDGGGSTKRIAMAVGAAVRAAEPVTHKDRVAAEEGRYVDEDSFCSQVEAERVAIEGVKNNSRFAKVQYGELQYEALIKSCPYMRLVATTMLNKRQTGELEIFVKKVLDNMRARVRTALVEMLGRSEGVDDLVTDLLNFKSREKAKKGGMFVVDLAHKLLGRRTFGNEQRYPMLGSFADMKDLIDKVFRICRIAHPDVFTHVFAKAFFDQMWEIESKSKMSLEVATQAFYEKTYGGIMYAWGDWLHDYRTDTTRSAIMPTESALMACLGGDGTPPSLTSPRKWQLVQGELQSMYTEMKKGDPTAGTGFQGLRRKEGEGADQGEIVVSCYSPSYKGARSVVTAPGKGQKCFQCNQEGHIKANCPEGNGGVGGSGGTPAGRNQCWGFAKGECTRGAQCRFDHGEGGSKDMAIDVEGARAGTPVGGGTPQFAKNGLTEGDVTRLRAVGKEKFGCRSRQKGPEAGEVKMPWICLADAVYQHLGKKSADLKPCNMGAKCYSNHVFEWTRGVPGNGGAPWGQNSKNSSDVDAVDMCFVDKKASLKLSPGVAMSKRWVPRGLGRVAGQVGDPVSVGADRGGTEVCSTDDGVAELVEPGSAESAGQPAWQGQGLVEECEEEEDGQEDLETSDWDVVPPGEGGAGSDCYPQKRPTAKVAAEARGKGCWQMGEASHRVEGWVRKEFNEMRDSESWVKPVSGEFEGKPAEPYRGPWVVGSQAELFPRGMVATARNGEWVRRQLRAAGVDRIHWSAEDVVAQIQEWEARNRADLAKEHKADQEGHAGTHRKRCATFIIRQEDILGEGSVIWDLRELQTWRTQGSVGEPPRIRAQDPGEKPRIRLNAERLRARAMAAGITDEYKLQQLCEIGVFTHSEARRDMLLAVNYRAVAEHSVFCAKTAADEEEVGILSEGYGGVPFVPCRINPRQVVEGEKPRIVGDLGAPRQDEDGGGENSVNSGIAFWDDERLQKMTLTSAVQFARNVGVVQSAGVPVTIGKADYSRYFRQLAKPPCEYWHQVLWTQSAHCNIDYSVTFGDGAGPAGCHVGSDVFVALYHHEFEVRVQQMQSWTEVEWQGHSHGQQETMEALAKLEAWSVRRAAILRRDEPEQCQDPAWLTRQLRVHEIEAFFDDSMFAVADVLFVLMVKAVLEVSADLDLEMAYHKVHCGTSDGRTGALNATVWTASQTIDFEPLDKGNMQVLGKEMDTVRQIVQDSDERLDQLVDKIDDLAESSKLWRNSQNAAKDGVRVAPVGKGRSVLGNAFYVATTAPTGRGLLNRPLRGMRASETIDPEANKAHRAQPKFRSRKEPWFAFWFFSQECEDDLRELVATARQCGGLHFTPMVSKPGADDRVTVWVMLDAAGMRRRTLADGTLEELPMSEQGSAAAWLVWVKGDQIVKLEWHSTRWTHAELSQHSTWQEPTNANWVLRHCLQHGAQDVVECLDSKSGAHVLRRLACQQPGLESVARDRAAIMVEYPGARVWTLHDVRTLAKEADALSKLHLAFEKTGKTGLRWAMDALRARGIGALSARNRMQPRPVS